MNVLLTNDDGINAPGLRALYSALRRAGHTVTAVAPMRQQSGVGHSLTVYEPLRFCPVREEGFEGIGIHGTPVDCVKLALGELLPARPDLVMSGINLGPNAGPDIFYSGTVGAAAEACQDALPSMAVSHGGHNGCGDIDAVAAHAVSLAEKIDWRNIPPRRVMNLNYPAIPLGEAKGVKVCAQSPAVWRNTYSRREDPRGQAYWWLEGELDEERIGRDSDRGLLARGYITLTPLKYEYTDHDSLEALKKMDLER